MYLSLTIFSGDYIKRVKNSWACIVKHYVYIIYGKWTDFEVSQCLFLVNYLHWLGQTHYPNTESMHYESIKFLQHIPLGPMLKNRVFVPGKRFMPSLTSTLAWYEIRKSRTKQFYSICPQAQCHKTFFSVADADIRAF